MSQTLACLRRSTPYSAPPQDMQQCFVLALCTSSPAALPLYLESDSFAVVRTVQGKSGPHPSGPLVRVAAPVWLALSQCAPVRIEHVKGHSGHPRNPLVRFSARSALLGMALPPPVPLASVESTVLRLPREW
eukprot:1586085-Pyramimonas_sp.AAC.1